MKVKELAGTFEKQRTICYKVDGNSITYHNKEMQHIGGNLYSGQVEQEGNYYKYCMLYVLYPEQKIAMEIGTINADYSIDEAMEMCKKNGLDTQEAFITMIKRKIDNQDHVQLSWIEYLKYIDPSLIDACMESRKAFAKKREQISKERKEKREAEDQQYVAERNAEAEKMIAAAIEVIKNGGTLENDRVVFYRSKYDSIAYSIVNYLMRKNGVNVPIKTQGWINDKLIQVEVTKDGGVSGRFWKTKGSNGSQKFFECMLELVRIVRSENQEGEVKNDGI